MSEDVIKAVITAVQGLYNPAGTSPLNPVTVDPGLSPVRGVTRGADNFNSAVKAAGKTVSTSRTGTSPTISVEGSHGEGESGRSGNVGGDAEGGTGVSPGSAAEGTATV